MLWGCCGLCQRHKNQPSLPTPFYSVLVSFCLYDPFTCVSFYKCSRELSPFPLYSFGLISPLLVLSATFLFMEVSLSSDIILCGWLVLKRQVITNSLLQYNTIPLLLLLLLFLPLPIFGSYICLSPDPWKTVGKHTFHSEKRNYINMYSCN